MTGRPQWRDAGANLLLSAVGSVLVVIVPGFQAGASATIADSLFGKSTAVQMILGILSWAFVIVAVTVATSTSTNAFAVVLASRFEELAVRRLLGASARHERRRLTRLGVAVSALGCVLGGASGLVLLLLGAPESLRAPWTWVSILIGLIAMFVATIIGSSRAARQILDAAPVGGLRLAQQHHAGPSQDAQRPPVVFFAGLVVLVASIPLSLASPFAIFIGVIGGMMAMIGSLSAMTLMLTTTLRIVRRLAPRGGTLQITAQLLSTRIPATARAASGLLTGVAVTTTFVVALSTLTAALAASYKGDASGAIAVQNLQAVTAGMGATIALIVLLTAVGLCSTTLHSIRQRKREIATLRILGQPVVGAQRVIANEIGLVCTAAVVPGVLLGAFTGWVGAQDVLGSVRELGILSPVVPLSLLAALVFGSIALITVITTVATRGVLSVPPVRAVSA
jgi:putative ABC transport system permease protein